MHRDYQDKVNFFYVYKNVQHPEINGFVTAFNLEERLMHVAEAKRRFQTEIPWICDRMDNSFKKAFGGAPNGEFVVDAEGKIIRKRFWSNPGELRSYLEELVGKSKTTTTVDDLPATFTPQVRDIASGVVPRLELPRLMPMKVVPRPDDENPFFVKLRVEATPNAFSSEAGEGKLYLVAYLDPLYKVHWNNRAGKIKLDIKPGPGQSFQENSLQGPDVESDADIDPREFLVDFEFEEQKPFEVSLTYTVCDDAETFCLTITQTCEVSFGNPRNMGSRPGVFMPGFFAKVREFDKNGDGDLTKDELPEGEVTLYIGHMDYNGDDVIQKAEIDKFLSMFNNGQGFHSNKNDGG